MKKLAKMIWHRFPEGRLADTGSFGSVDVEITECPASGKYFGTAICGDSHVEIGGTFGLPKTEARRAVAAAARQLARHSHIFDEYGLCFECDQA